MSTLPTRIHIGTQKAGSTFLYQLLCQHPDVSMSSMSEIHYYTSHFDKGREWYLQTFSGALPMIDISPKYFMCGDVAAPRMAQTVGGNAKLLLILRNPIDYLNSHFQMQYQSGYFTHAKHLYPDVPSSIVDFVNRYPAYLDRARYHHLLTTYWLKYFAKAQIKIVLFEEFIRQPQVVMDEICDFWDIPRHDFSLDSPSKNAMLRFSFLYPLKHKVVNIAWLRRLLKRNAWFMKIYDRHLTASSKQKLSEQDRAHLREFFVDDVNSLTSLCDRSFAQWTDFI